MHIVFILPLVRCIDDVIDVKTIISGWPLNTGLTVMMRRICLRLNFSPVLLSLCLFVCLFDCPVFKARTRKHHRDRHSSTILDGLKPCESEIAPFSQPWSGGWGGGVGLGLNFPSGLFKIVVRHILCCFGLIDWLNDSCQEIFKMDKEAFNKLPGWKQVNLKKAVRLF